MRKVIVIIFSFIIFVNTIEVLSLDTNVVKYYPFKLGNVWVVHYTTTHTYQTNHYYKSIVDSTILVSGHIFYRFKTICKYISGYPQCGGIGYGFYRIDSTTGIVYGYSQNYGCYTMPNYYKYDSLLARKFDTVRICEDSPRFRVCVDTSIQTILGVPKPIKKFTAEGFEFYSEKKYAKDIGLCLEVGCGAFSCDTRQLVGAIINGIVYGDTSFITGIDPLAQEFPEYYYLSQNYPNPFNPVTTITFDISKTHNIKLTIYDVTGKEIEAIVDKELSPGRYKASWDGAAYASGVYFYSLKTESFTQTKRMVLVK